MPSNKAGLLFDACATIDLYDVEPDVIIILSRSYGPIFTPAPVWKEVRLKGNDDAPSLGISLIEPTLEALAAASCRQGPLSFEDHLCVLVAGENDLICVTNDKRMRAECALKKVDTWWVLEMLGRSVKDGVVGSREAERIVEDISRNNRRIPRSLVEDFKKKYCRRLA